MSMNNVGSWHRFKVTVKGYTKRIDFRFYHLFYLKLSGSTHPVKIRNYAMHECCVNEIVFQMNMFMGPIWSIKI